jgi:hypothetical protein
MNLKSNKHLPILITAGLVLITTACGTQSGGLDEAAFEAALKTAVAATSTAQAAELQKTEDARIEFTATSTDAPLPTNTSLPDTPTLEPTATESPEVETSPEPPAISLRGSTVQVSVDTNCRSGPGKVYPYLGALLVGEQASIYGIDPSGAWYYINNPDLEDGYCWIWANYAQTAQNIASLPVFTPGPTPVPEPKFSVAFREVENCAGAWQVEFEIANTGLFTLESISTFVQDTVTSATSGNSSKNWFEKKTGCAVDQTQDRRGPGDTGFTVSLDLGNNPTGHLTYASITACTLDNLAGDCTTKELYFTP